MAWNHQHPNASMGATFVPGAFDDDYYMPVATPPLVAPEPQRYGSILECPAACARRQMASKHAGNAHIWQD